MSHKNIIHDPKRIGAGAVGAHEFVEPLDTSQNDGTQATEEDLADDLRCIASDMMQAISDHERYGPGAIVEFQLGKVGRPSLTFDPDDTLRKAANEIERLRAIKQRVEALAEKWDRDPALTNGGRTLVFCASELREALRA